MLRKQDGPTTTFSHVLGYCVADSDNEARGIAVAKAFTSKPDFDIANMSVLHIPCDEVAAAIRARSAS
jgi:hypothetical protein